MTLSSYGYLRGALVRDGQRDIEPACLRKHLTQGFIGSYEIAKLIEVNVIRHTLFFRHMLHTPERGLHRGNGELSNRFHGVALGQLREIDKDDFGKLHEFVPLDAIDTEDGRNGRLRHLREAVPHIVIDGAIRLVLVVLFPKFPQIIRDVLHEGYVLPQTIIIEVEQAANILDSGIGEADHSPCDHGDHVFHGVAKIAHSTLQYGCQLATLVE